MSRGQWVVVLRDILANEDEFLGPFHSEDKASEVATRLTGDAAARNASEVVEAFVKWIRPGVEVEDVRDEMLADLDERGFEKRQLAPGGQFGSWRGE